MRYRVSILLMIFIIAACSTANLIENKYMGKKININKFKYLSNNGQHFWEFKNFEVKYDYLIDAESKNITLKGTAIYTQPIAERKYKSEQVLLKYERIEIILVLADLSGKVVGVESYYIYPDSYLVDPIPFKVTVPYENHYQLISFAAHYYARGD